MATITTRAGKGSPLTNTEVDDNFSNLNSAKYESGSSPTLGVTQITGANDVGLRVHSSDNASAINISDTGGSVNLQNYGGTLKIRTNGTHSTYSGSIEMATFSTSGIVFNDGSYDADFRVESNNDSHMLFVDAGNDRVGIKNGTPLFPLSVGATGSLGAVSGNYQTLVSVDGGYSTTNVRQHKVMGFVGTTAGNADVYDSGYLVTNGEISKNFYTGIFADNSYFNASSYRIVQGAKNRLTIKQNGELVINDSGDDRDFRVESDSSTHMLFVDGGENHVGVDWATPNVPLDVNGVISSRPNGGGAAYSHGLLEISTSASNPQVKITTNILWGAGATTHAHTVKISGFRYGSGQTCEVVICWHKYNNSFYNRTASSSGGFAPDITLAVENNKVVIHLGTVGYWPKLYVESMYNAYGGTSQAKGWSWSDAAISADANTPTETVSYKTDLGGDNLIGTAGVVFNEGSAAADFRVESDGNAHMLFVDASTNRVGVGTNGPGADFTVYKAGANSNGVAQIYQNAATNYPTLYLKQRGEGGNSNDRQGLMIDIAGQNGGAGKMIATLTTNSNINSGVAFEPFTLWNGGTFQFRLGGTINENGQNSDFRVESDSNASMLVVDASANRVGIGVSPSKTLDVNGPVVFRTGGSTPVGTVDNYSSGLEITGGNQRLNIDVSGATNGGAYLQTRHKASAYPTAYYNLKLNPLGGHVIINEEGHSNSGLRVESDNKSHMLFVDGGNDRVTIGSSSNLGGMFNVAGSMKMMNTSNKVTSSMRPSGWGYSQGAYGVTIIGGDNDTGGTVSIGFDPSVNPSGAFSGYGQEMIFNKDMSFYQSNTANDGWVRQIRMEKSTGVIINENSLSDIDFRVESNTKGEMLYVDAGNDVVNINSTQTTHQMGSGYRADGKLRDFQRDEAVGTFNDSATASTPARTRRLIIPLHNYGPVEITIINGGHRYNNGGHFGTRVTKFYAAIEGTALRINTRRDIMQQGNNDWGVPVLTAHANATLRIDWTVAALVTCSTHVRVVGYGTKGITSCTTI